jgi:predicted ester cyclase
MTNNSAIAVTDPERVARKGDGVNEEGGPDINSTDRRAVEHNTRIAREWIDEFNKGNRAKEEEILTSDYIAYPPASLSPSSLDHDGWTMFLDVFVQGFPDLHLEIEAVVADEHMVAQRIRFTGTHTGDFQGLPPTNRNINFTGLELNRVRDGRFDAHWFELDQVTMMRQLGLTIVPGPRLVPRLISGKIKQLLGLATRAR